MTELNILAKKTGDLFAELIFRKHMKRNRDCVILIEQDKGFGKSTLAIRLGKRWNEMARERLGYPNKFSYDTDVIYHDNVDQIKPMIKGKPIHSVDIFDEGARIALAEDWNKKANKEIKKLVSEMRTKHHTIILNFPYAIEDVDKKYFKNFIDYWIHIWGYGIATIFRKNLAPMNKGFNLELLNKMLQDNGFEYVDEVTSLEEFKKIQKVICNHPCYMGELFWLPLGQDEYAHYQKKRDHYVYDDDGATELIETRTDKKLRDDKTKLIKYIKEKYGGTYKEVAELLGVKPTTVSKFMTYTNDDS